MDKYGCLYCSLSGKRLRSENLDVITGTGKTSVQAIWEYKCVSVCTLQVQEVRMHKLSLQRKNIKNIKSHLHLSCLWTFLKEAEMERPLHFYISMWEEWQSSAEVCCWGEGERWSQWGRGSSSTALQCPLQWIPSSPTSQYQYICGNTHLLQSIACTVSAPLLHCKAFQNSAPSVYQWFQAEVTLQI